MIYPVAPADMMTVSIQIVLGFMTVVAAFVGMMIVWRA